MAVSLAQFLDRLIDGGLMAKADVDTFVDGLPAKCKPKDAQQLARELVREKRLTAFQTDLLLEANPDPLVLGDYVVLDKKPRTRGRWQRN